MPIDLAHARFNRALDAAWTTPVHDLDATTQLAETLAEMDGYTTLDGPARARYQREAARLLPVILAFVLVS